MIRQTFLPNPGVRGNSHHHTIISFTGACDSAMSFLFARVSSLPNNASLNKSGLAQILPAGLGVRDYVHTTTLQMVAMRIDIDIKRPLRSGQLQVS